MSNQETFVAVAMNAWNTNIERAEKLFFNLSKEQLHAEVAPGKNRLIYLWGHFTAVHDAMLPLLGFGPRLYPQLDTPFITSPDKAVADLPPVEELKKSWDDVTRKLSEGLAKLTAEDWLARHNSVSAEDFAKNPLRNRFAILLSRTNHVSYHLGQAILVSK
jgi:DinB superfamily